MAPPSSRWSRSTRRARSKVGPCAPRTGPIFSNGADGRIVDGAAPRGGIGASHQRRSAWMSSSSDWEMPHAVQPKPENYAYDLEGALTSLVGLRAIIPADAFTAETLGTERTGNGVLIREGVVLTIGYLVTEAETIWLHLADGRAVPGHVLAYDQETGFGLVQALARIELPALPIGQSKAAKVGDSVVVAGAGGRKHSVVARIAAKQEFAGNWEYVLDEAIFTAPAHPFWGGTAMIGRAGELLGIGSLQVQQVRESGTPEPLNMIVPIDILKPILEDGFENIDGHDHVEWLGRPAFAHLLHLQRADAQKLARASDHRSTAPERMRRRGEDRLVEHVFPIAGEFLLGGDARHHRMLASARAGDHDGIAHFGRLRLADRQRGQLDARQRLDQPEAGLLVVGQDVTGNRAAVREVQPDRFRLGDEVSDGEHHALADQDAVAGALGAQRLGGERVGGNDGTQPHQRGQGSLEVIGVNHRVGLDV